MFVKAAGNIILEIKVREEFARHEAGLGNNRACIWGEETVFAVKIACFEIGVAG